MVLKPEQERVRTLLVDTITLLCRNGLSFKTEFNINALIGITLDKEDIFLVDIRETIKNAAAEQQEATTTTSEQTVNTSKSRKRRKTSSRDVAETSESEAETEASSHTTSKKNADKRANTPTNSSKDASSSSKEPPSKRLVKQEMFENLTHTEGEEGEEDRNLLIVKPEPGYRHQMPCDTNNANSMGGQQSNMYNTDSLPGPSSWDPGQQQHFNPQGQQQQTNQQVGTHSSYYKFKICRM